MFFLGEHLFQIRRELIIQDIGLNLMKSVALTVFTFSPPQACGVSSVYEVPSSQLASFWDLASFF